MPGRITVSYAIKLGVGKMLQLVEDVSHAVAIRLSHFTIYMVTIQHSQLLISA